MSELMEIKRRMDRLTKLGNRMREQLTRLNSPESEEMKKKAKEQGARIGIGVGVSFLGLLIASVAAVYILAVVILLVDIALDRLWLSALIVVGGFLIIGCGVVAIGAGIASSSAKELSKIKDDAKQQIKETTDELKTEVEGLQEIAKKEAVELQGQLSESAKFAAPAAAGAYMGYKILQRALRQRKEKKTMIKVVKMVDAARAEEKRS